MSTASIDGVPIWKWATVYIVIIVLGTFLFSAVWGGVSGLVLGAKFAADPALQEELQKSLGKEAFRHFDLQAFKNLPPDKRNELEAILKKRYKEVDWFPIHLAVNAITFGILGLVAGLFRMVRYSVFIPIGLSFITLRILGAEDFKVYSQWMTEIMGFMTQVGAVYLSAFTGYWIRNKRIKSHNSRKRVNEAPPAFGREGEKKEVDDGNRGGNP